MIKIEGKRGKNRTENTLTRSFYGCCNSQTLLDLSKDKNWRILLAISFTLCMSLLTAT